MKKYILTVFLLCLLGFTYVYKQEMLKENMVDTVIELETVEKVKTKEIINLKIYVPLTSKVENKEIEIKNKEFLTIGDYVKLTLKNSEFLSNKMDLLSVYEISDDEVMIILSNEFSELSRSSFVAINTTLKLNVKEAFPKVRTINIKLDGEN